MKKLEFIKGKRALKRFFLFSKDPEGGELRDNIKKTNMEEKNILHLKKRRIE